MSIHIRCVACEYGFKIRDQFAGKKGKCPKCGNVFLAPGGPSKAGAAPPAPPPPPPKVRPAKTAAQPDVKPEGLPVGQAVDPAKAGDSGIAVGQAVVTPVPVGAQPAVASVQAVSVAPVGIHDGAAHPSRPHRGRARRKGMPIWGWGVLLLAGGAAVAGWIALAGKGKPQPAVAAANSADAALPSEESEEREAAERAAAQKASEPQTDEAEPSDADEAPAAAKKTVKRVVRPAPAASADANQAPTDDAPPQTEPDAEPNDAADEIAQLVEGCAAFEWRPAADSHYAQLSQLAARMSAALEGKGGPAAADAAEHAFLDTIAKVKWTAARVRSVNQFAAPTLEQPDAGLFAIGTLKQAVAGAWVLEVKSDTVGVKLMQIEVDPDRTQAKLESQWLVIGVTRPREISLVLPGADDKPTARVVKQMYLMDVPPPPERDPFGPAREEDE